MLGVLKQYGRVAAQAGRLAVKAWPLALALPAYVALVIIIIVRSMQLGPNVGGLVAGLAMAPVASSYLHLLSVVVPGRRLTWSDVKSSFGARLWDVISVMFAFMIINLLVGSLVAGMPKGTIVAVLVGIAMTVFFNPVPELLYQGNERSFGLLGAAARFISAYGLEWLFPNIILGLLLLAPTGILQASEMGGRVLLLARLFSMTGLSATLLSIPLLYILPMLAVVHWAMIFRGLLFHELVSGTGNRQRLARDVWGRR